MSVVRQAQETSNEGFPLQQLLHLGHHRSTHKFLSSDHTQNGACRGFLAILLFQFVACRLLIQRLAFFLEDIQ